MTIHITPQCPFCKNPLEGWHAPPVQYGASWSGIKQWQKCPVCEGTGRIFPKQTLGPYPCPACKGSCMVVAP